MENMFVFVLDYSSATAHRYAFTEAVCQDCIEEFLCKVPVHNVDGVGWEEPVITYKSQIE